jgi:glyceraldehyde 3-phosphate dehydrogenase
VGAASAFARRRSTTMAIRIAINGFGRIGRNVFRVIRDRSDIEVVAINDLAAPDALAHMLKYDSIMGRYPDPVSHEDGALVVAGTTIKVLQERDPAALPWKELEVDVAIESTGIFRGRAQVESHLTAGASRVVLTVPPKEPLDATIVLGVNDADLKPEHKLISNASCTTNCLAPMAKVLNDVFGIEQGLMTTVHAYTNDQRIHDLLHPDLRRARAAAQNIIPTTTGAAKAVGSVLPELDGKLNGMAMRVPVPDGSIVDLVCNTTKKVSVEAVNRAFEMAANGPMKGVLEYTADPIVSTDIIGNPHSCVFDSLASMVIGENMVKVVGWYDNEWGYSNRVVDLIVKAQGL